MLSDFKMNLEFHFKTIRQIIIMPLNSSKRVKNFKIIRCNGVTHLNI